VNYDASLLNYFLHAGLVVKSVMIILLTASIFSWACILQRFFYIRQVNRNSRQFENAFWSGEDLATLYNDTIKDQADGTEAIFHSGYKEFMRFRKLPNALLNQVLDNTSRAMRVAQTRMLDKLELGLPFLAIVGSTSPYVGLFGTVWGIMESFQALSSATQATLTMVAPGIAEALVATAMGLFAAIPAVIGYNRFITDIGRINSRFDSFREEFTNVLTRQTQPIFNPATAPESVETVEV